MRAKVGRWCSCSTTSVAPFLSEGGGSSSAGCFSGVVVGDSVTLAAVGAGVGANVLFLQPQGNLCLGAGVDMVTSNVIMRFGIALGWCVVCLVSWRFT